MLSPATSKFFLKLKPNQILKNPKSNGSEREETKKSKVIKMKG